LKLAKTFYHYSCGCGFTTEKEEAAKAHVDEKKHKMDIKGSVTP